MEKMKPSISNFGKDYSNFTFEDFLQDDFFISGVAHPTNESYGFWKRFRIENNTNRKDFEQAWSYIESLQETVRKYSQKYFTYNFKLTTGFYMGHIILIVAAIAAIPSKAVYRMVIVK